MRKAGESAELRGRRDTSGVLLRQQQIAALSIALLQGLGPPVCPSPQHLVLDVSTGPRSGTRSDRLHLTDSFNNANYSGLQGPVMLSGDSTHCGARATAFTVLLEEEGRHQSATAGPRCSKHTHTHKHFHVQRKVNRVVGRHSEKKNKTLIIITLLLCCLVLFFYPVWVFFSYLLIIFEL